MISLVYALALAATGPTVTAPPPVAAWTPDARCAAALSVEAEKPDRLKGAERPVVAAGDPLPIEALIKMNRATDVARAEGQSKAVVERDVSLFKAEYRRFDADHP